MTRSRHSKNLLSQISPHSSSLNPPVWPYLTSHIRAEKTASALESRLTDVESRIDQLLASVEENEKKDRDSPADVSANSNIMTPLHK